MQFSISISRVVGGGLVVGAIVLAVGCSSSSSSSAGPSDAGTNDGSLANTDSGNTVDSGGAGEGGDNGNDGGSSTCSPTASCAAPNKTCIGLVENKGQTKYGLRMSELDLTSPTALTTGIVGNIFSGAVAPALASCNLMGTGTFSWLLQFDTQAMTLKTGGAKPVTDPTQGYSFDTETLNGLNITPITYDGIAPDPGGNFSVTSGMDVVIPVFLNAAGTSVIVLPLHKTRILNANLSSDHDCIGTYNAGGLDPQNSCNPDSTHPQFIDAASLDGYISLEEADQIMISSVNASLCALLTGNVSQYGMVSDDAGGANVCKRGVDGKIVYQGKWCGATNMPADMNCADAEQLKGTFAASSVKILN